MIVVKRVFFIVSGIFFTLLLSVVLFVVARSDEVGPAIRLEEYEELSATADSDGDGVPNWLEEINGSDSLNASSFPYNRDVVQARRNISDELLYDGPGDFTEEIVQRFLFDVDGSATVTEEEEQRFAAESSEYFLQAVEERGLPDIALSIDDSVSRQEVLSGFVSALQAFSGDKPIDVVIFDIFSQNAASTDIAYQMRASCEKVLQTFPRKIPRDVYEPYHFVLRRVTNLCEALDVALTSAAPGDFFYALYLVGNTIQQDDAESSEQGDGVTEDNEFEMAVYKVVQLLGE